MAKVSTSQVGDLGYNSATGRSGAKGNPMKPTALFLLIAMLIGAALAIDQLEKPAKRPLTLTLPLQDKNYYLLSLLESSPAVREAIKQDKTFAAMTKERWSTIGSAHCNNELDCVTTSFRWSDDQIWQGAQALAALYRKSEAIQSLAERELRTSGMYLLYLERCDTIFPKSFCGPELVTERCEKDLRKKSWGEEVLNKPVARMLACAWNDSIRGINRAIDIYGAGKAPERYADVNSMTQDVKNVEWRYAVQNLASVLDEEHAATASAGEQSDLRGRSLDLPFSPSLRFAVELMEMNQRDEAGRHEPMESELAARPDEDRPAKGVNAAAIAHILELKPEDWNTFNYSVIVVPGRGPDVQGVHLSPLGRVRDELAARHFRNNEAPFILVSGGYVHPNQTKFCEAIEMKRDLMKRFNVPEKAIIVDPHARHTTTNMRNAARLIYHYDIPFDKKALVTTDPMQSADIESAAFGERCLHDLGFMPFRLVGRISPFDLEFYPLIASLQADPTDLLDP